MKKLWAWVKTRANHDRAVLLGALGTALLWLQEALVSNDFTDWRTALIPLVTGVVIRVFVTSDGVTPGIRSKG